MNVKRDADTIRTGVGIRSCWCSHRGFLYHATCGGVDWAATTVLFSAMGGGLVRMWIDPKGALVDDQRLLAYVVSHGSLSKALEDGDFVLLSDTNSAPRDSALLREGERMPRKRLADYLEG